MPILTIDSARLNGTPSAGMVRITASRSPLMDSGSNTVFSGTQTFQLDAQGKLSVSLPATDSPSIGMFTYTVEANLASGQWVYRGVRLPASVGTIDITDAQSASQKVYPTKAEWDAITAGMNAAIAGKVTGQGMSLQYDSQLGERVFLVHPGGSVMIHGDTGWRRIGDSLLNGWKSSSLRIRRINHTVEIQGRLDATEKTDDAFLELPRGYVFTAGSFTRTYGVTGGNLVLRAGGTLSSTAETAYIDLLEVWTTTDVWPVPLPGTP